LWPKTPELLAKQHKAKANEMRALGGDSNPAMVMREFLVSGVYFAVQACDKEAKLTRVAATAAKTAPAAAAASAKTAGAPEESAAATDNAAATEWIRVQRPQTIDFVRQCTTFLASNLEPFERHRRTTPALRPYFLIWYALGGRAHGIPGVLTNPPWRGAARRRHSLSAVLYQLLLELEGGPTPVLMREMHDLARLQELAAGASAGPVSVPVERVSQFARRMEPILAAALHERLAAASDLASDRARLALPRPHGCPLREMLHAILRTLGTLP
jgi:hypothetical protein